jgi:cytochrome bd-type quinol oxidase subunit 2
MSSPGARQRRRREQYQAPRPRREVAIAAGAALLIIGVTALMIWMLRPGGVADRQPRSTWLFGIALFAVVVACYVILRPSSRLKGNQRMLLAVALGGIALVTALAAIFWPGGLLRHTATFPTIPTAPTAPISTATTTPSTTAASSTTSTGATTTSAAATTTSTIP